MFFAKQPSSLHQEGASSLAWLSNKLLLSGGRDRLLRLWSVSCEGKLMLIWVNHQDVLIGKEANFSGVRGLSEDDQLFLEQRDARMLLMLFSELPPPSSECCQIQ